MQQMSLAGIEPWTLQIFDMSRKHSAIRGTVGFTFKKQKVVCGEKFDLLRCKISTITLHIGVKHRSRYCI